MNIYTKKGMVAVATAMLALGAMPASAYDIECDKLDVEGLRDVFNSYVTVSDKDKGTLNAKLDEALEKEGLAKYCDAGQKVDDFAAKIVGLLSDTRKVKISESHEGAIQCVLVGADYQADRYRAMDSRDCDAVGGPPTGKGPK